MSFLDLIVNNWETVVALLITLAIVAYFFFKDYYHGNIDCICTNSHDYKKQGDSEDE